MFRARLTRTGVAGVLVALPLCWPSRSHLEHLDTADGDADSRDVSIADGDIHVVGVGR